MQLERFLAALGIFSWGHPCRGGSDTGAAELPTQFESLLLFGKSAPWNTSSLTWTAVDDRVRGGSSMSYLEADGSEANAATFYGHLDTSTLGGAGFASQSTVPTADKPVAWDLSAYDGIGLALGAGDNKTYTLTLKDSLPTSKRPDGRERSSISWEATFVRRDASAAAGVVFLPWTSFKATYRGREKKDAEPLKTDGLKRVGLMMRSFFEEQAGDFSLEIRSIAAVRRTSSAQGSPEEL